MLTRWIGIAAAVLWLTGGSAAAHEGHLHRHMGTITAVAADQLTLKTTDGKTMTFALDQSTTVTKGDAEASKDDLAAGLRAVVQAAQAKSGPPVAKRIRLAAAPAQG